MEAAPHGVEGKFYKVLHGVPKEAVKVHVNVIVHVEVS